jgi:adenine/guanine phosphoribosyltransferase-like PRPP-binding protein
VAVDRRGRLGEQPFTIRVTRDKVLVSFRGRQVATLVGPQAEAVRAAAAAGDEAQVQLLVARATGNFKRGNERRGDS